jgi:hypothetical protein
VVSSVWPGFGAWLFSLVEVWAMRARIRVSALLAALGGY